MQRRTYVAGIGTALATGLAGCSALGSDDGGDDGNSSDDGNGSPSDGTPGSDDEQQDDGSGGNEADLELVNGSFESGFEGWTVGTDLPAVPGEDDGTVDHGVSILNGTADDGDAALQCYVSGVADDGTIWVEQRIDFTDVATVEVAAYSEEASFNEIAKLAFFAGEKPEDGLEEGDFDTDEHVEDHEGWKTYSYDVSDRSGAGTLAVGITVIWETEVRRLLDHVALVGGEA